MSSGPFAAQMIAAGRGLGFGDPERDPRRRRTGGAPAGASPVAAGNDAAAAGDRQAIPGTSAYDGGMSWLQRLLTIPQMPPQAVENVPEMNPRFSHGGSFASGIINSAGSGLTFARDVLQGRVDPRSEEFIERGLDMAGMGMTGGLAGTGAAAGTALQSGLPDLRIAQRIPWAKNQATDPHRLDLRANQEAMRGSPESYAKNSAELDPFLRENMRDAPVEERYGAARAFMVDNLRHLYETAHPEIQRRAPSWYPGGRRLAEGMGQEFGIPTQSSAAMIAALSPQKDWFQNVELARRIGGTLGEDPIVTQQMIDALRNKGGGMGEHAPLLTSALGRRVSDLDPTQAARATWAHDVATRPKSYATLSPEGEIQGLSMGSKGPNSLQHQQLGATQKAVEAYRGGGDVDQISRLMGANHKVRNFYNDIIAPYAKYDDYTSDTHNVAAAAFRPLGASSPIVGTGLGMTGSKSAETGMKGLYGLYADAGREAARLVGQPDPSALQSVVWENIRQNFPDKFKTARNVEDVENLWGLYRSGTRSQADVRAMIEQMARDRARQQAPVWMGR